MSNQADNEGAEMTFGEHLDELRKILIRVALIFSVLFIVFFILKGIVLDIVFAPIRPEFPTNRLCNIHPENVELFNNKMAGQFMLHIKRSIVGAFVVAFPYLIWELWLFVKPALPPYQRKQSIRYVVETPVWFIIGLLFGYYVISPLAINFLGNYTVSDQISNIIDVGSFMSTVLGVSFAGAIAFQLPLLIRLLATLGIIGSESMRQYRKLATVVLLVFSAVITPPDVVSQILIFVPCYALYEYGIRIARRIEIQREKAEAEYMARMEAEGSAVKPTETEETAQDNTVSALDRENESDEKPETDDAEK